VPLPVEGAYLQSGFDGRGDDQGSERRSRRLLNHRNTAQRPENEECAARAAPEVVDWDDVRVLEPRDQLGFGLEPLDEARIVEVGACHLDRDGTFELSVLPKHARRLDGFNDAILTGYAKGNTTGDIQALLRHLYGTEVSRELIFEGHRRVVDEMVGWQNRPLEAVFRSYSRGSPYQSVHAGSGPRLF